MNVINFWKLIKKGKYLRNDYLEKDNLLKLRY